MICSDTPGKSRLYAPRRGLEITHHSGLVFEVCLGTCTLQGFAWLAMVIVVVAVVVVVVVVAAAAFAGAGGGGGGGGAAVVVCADVVGSPGSCPANVVC